MLTSLRQCYTSQLSTEQHCMTPKQRCYGAHCISVHRRVFQALLGVRTYFISAHFRMWTVKVGCCHEGTVPPVQEQQVQVQALFVNWHVRNA